MHSTRLAALLVSVLVAAAPASAAERNYTVVSFDRVRLEGGYRVALTTGVSPFARASGSQAALDAVAIEVQGRTLVVRANRSSWGGYPGTSPGPVEISVGTHELRAAWVNGAGSLAIDAVRGLSFDLAVEGAGGATIDRVDVDHLRLAVAGAASARLAGRAPRLTATVRGNSALDGTELAVKDATLGAEGAAIVKLQASNSAKVAASGPATITISGAPACTLKVTGTATVDGCK